MAAAVAAPAGGSRIQLPSLGARRGDMLNALWADEHRFRTYRPNAKYHAHRHLFVDWMSDTGETHNFQFITVHMGVRYFDRLLGQINVEKNKLQLIGLCCLWVAAKFQEREFSLPDLRQLLDTLNPSVNRALYFDMELQILKYLQWDLAVVTPYHFLVHYLQEGVVYAGDLVKGVPATSNTCETVKRTVDFLAELCMMHYEFERYLPSVLSATIIALARFILDVRPMWPKPLVRLTRYESSDIEECFLHLKDVYDQVYPASKKELSPDDLSDFFSDRDGLLRQEERVLLNLPEQPQQQQQQQEPLGLELPAPEQPEAQGSVLGKRKYSNED